MGTVLAHHPDPAGGVTEGDEILVHQPYADWVANDAGQLLREAEGQPGPADQLAHRRARTDAPDELRIFAR